ncbi:hypothetical protein BDF22DRAFT_702178 [Syncephalis plumigaleata]|nr:hypothetical protein BDF22DRAFT_702178 [Syncephalis plumigaleata]
MRSLFHQTTLTITAVLVLISCAIQAQVIGGSNLYARNYIEQRAINEGISNVQWKGGVGGVVSYAKLTYGEEPAYMTCTPINIEKAAFDHL